MTSYQLKNVCMLFSLICWSVIFSGHIEAQTEDGSCLTVKIPHDTHVKEMSLLCADNDEAARTIALALNSDIQILSPTLLQIIEVIPPYSAIDGDAEFLSDCGKSFFLMGEFEETIRCFNKAIRIDPNGAKYRRNRGLSLINLQKLDLAMADFHKSLDLDPHSIRGYYYVSRVFLAMGNMKKTVEYLKKASECGHEFNQWTEKEKGQIEARLKTAVEILNESEDKAAQGEEQSKGEDQNVTDESNDAMYYDPCGTDKYFEETELSLLNPGPLERETHLTHLVIAETLRDWGNEFFKSGDLEHALRCYDKAVQMMADEAKFYRNRGLCYSKMNKTDLATQDYKISLELEPENLVGHLLLGFHLFDMGKFAESVARLKKLLYFRKDRIWNGQFQLIIDKMNEAHKNVKEVKNNTNR